MVFLYNGKPNEYSDAYWLNELGEPGGMGLGKLSADICHIWLWLWIEQRKNQGQSV